MTIPGGGGAGHRAHLVTSSRNLIGRRARLYKTESILVDGCTIISDDVIIRADLAPVKIGRYCRIESGAILRPPLVSSDRDDDATFKGQVILDYVVIEKDAIVRATTIHNCSHIMERAIIGERAVIGPGARILPDTVIAPDSIIPPLTIYMGNPGKVVGRVDSDHEMIWKADASNIHKTVLSQARAN